MKGVRVTARHPVRARPDGIRTIVSGERPALIRVVALPEEPVSGGQGQGAFGLSLVPRPLADRGRGHVTE